ncbi:unnamed protein product [Adineta ricciae]|uniref:Uncharacterized protein n=2 Tax=Adineta ricciae TaxID=249248 RepID=A0A814Z324_ADIRI|nr:unnamed protein product [Adineta ricciae]
MNCLFLFVIFPLVSASTNCSIFPLLNCSCFRSSIDLPTATYSHLVCQGNSLNEQTFREPFGEDFVHQNQFRTISLEFLTDEHVEIQSNQFDPLAKLFSRTNSAAQIEIFLRFNGFSQITFHEYSLTSNIFQEKHVNQHLDIHLIPGRINSTEFYTNSDEQFIFSRNCFSGLTVSQLNLYIYSIQDHFPSSSSFEQIFNNTNLGELHIHGSIIPPNISPTNDTFQSLIKSLTLHRYVDTIDSNSFPFYPHVLSYTIHSIEAHSMNLSTFLPTYINLRGLEILKPKFEVLINHFIPTLDLVSLNIEHVTDQTLLAARHIRYLKFGSRLRSIDPSIFASFSRRLYQLDLSAIDLSQMTIESRCHLLTYFSNNSQSQLNILYPQFDNSTECNCDRIFIDHLRSDWTLEGSTCSKLCSFSDCQVVSEYFQEKSPLIVEENEQIFILNETIHETNITDEQFAAVDLFADDVDVDMMSFLINQTSEQERNETRRRPTTTTISVIEDIQEYDDRVFFSTPKIFDSSDEEFYRRPTFSWLSFFIGVSVVFFLFIFGSIVIFLIVQFRKKHNFKPVPLYV